MSKTVKAMILRTAGVNCDMESEYAVRIAGAETKKTHINSLIRGGDSLDGTHILVFPGGFSYGDDISAGKILANEIRFKIIDAVEKFISGGGLIIGICNGFQVLVKTGLFTRMPGEPLKQRVTLTNNDSGKFECRWITLKPEPGNKCVFTRGMEEPIMLPVAHGEGKLIFMNDEVRNKVESSGQVVFRYIAPDGSEPVYPQDPNGSQGHIAGICDPTGRIFGIMPHPERNAHPTNAPDWTRKPLAAEGPGLKIFRNAVQYVRENVL